MFGLIKKIKTFFVKQKIYHETYMELHQMNDRELTDIGISRGDIDHIAAEAARQQVAA